MELHGRRGIKENKNYNLRYEHNSTLYERDMTQQQTYLLLLPSSIRERHDTAADISAAAPFICQKET